MSDPTPAPPAAPPTRPRSRLAIFLSSTSLDLKAHRARVRQTIEKLHEHPVVMDDFGAQDGGALAVSLKELASAHIYVLLLGWRYGTIPANETLSVTHLEYRAAKAAGLPRLIFLADPTTEADIGPDALFPADVRDPAYAAQVRAFRDEVSHDRVIATFTTPESLLEAVVVALHQTIPEVIAQVTPLGPLPPNKLAPRAPGFVGRADDLRQLCGQLRAGQSVGLSALVAGLGGVGKSALAAEALATLAADPSVFPGGVTALRCDDRAGFSGLTWLYDQLLQDWGVPLAPEQVAQAQAHALAAASTGSTPPDGSDDPDAGPRAEADYYERALRTRFRAFASPIGTLPPALALLDNVERGFPLARALDTLAALNITALVTARHQPAVPRLHVQRLDVLDPAAAVALFAERYRAANASRQDAWDDTRDAAPAAQVVAALGHLPLAIELQAARAAVLQTSVADLAAALQRDRGQGLLGDPTDATRTMRYSFDQSLRALTPLQRTRFAALGLPEGPDWPRPVIERLFAGIPDSAATVTSDDANASEDSDDAEDTEPSPRALASARDDLALLVALSLATLQPPDGRVRLHPLLREYAHQRWQAEPAATHTAGLRTLLAALLDLVTEREHDFAALTRDEELIVAALDQAQASHTSPRLLIRVVDALGDYLRLGSPWRLGMQLLHWQLLARRTLGVRRDEGVTLNNLGYLARSLGQPDEARDYYEQALLITREVGDRAGEGATLNNLGSLVDGLGQPEAARDYFEQALAIHREVGNRAMEGTTLNNLGYLARRLGPPDEARRYYEQALAIFQDIGAVDSARATADNVASLAADNSNTPSAAAPETPEPPNAPPASPPEKPLPPKRHRWPWRRKPAQ